METKIILCGLGGQGIVFLTRLIAQVALAMELPVMVSETHGMSQRGGSVMSHVKIGGNRQMGASAAPLIQMGTADLLFAMDADEAVRNLPYLRKGGTLFANAENGLRPEVSEAVERLNFVVHCVPASQIAVQLGVPAIANVVLAGFSTAFPENPLLYKPLRKSVEKVAKRNLALNLQAFEAGYQAGQESLVTAH